MSCAGNSGNFTLNSISQSPYDAKTEHSEKNVSYDFCEIS